MSAHGPMPMAPWATVPERAARPTGPTGHRHGERGTTAPSSGTYRPAGQPRPPPEEHRGTPRKTQGNPKENYENHGNPCKSDEENNYRCLLHNH